MGSKQPASRDDTPRRAGPDLDAVGADAALVKRCVAGEVAAWEELYHQCHPPLLRFVECTLGPSQRDPQLIDELAARVWYALIDNDGEILLKFDPARGARLGTFIRAVARGIISHYFRAESRRQRRELHACRELRRRPFGLPDESATALREFRTTLTPGEQDYLDACVEGRIEDGGAAESEAGQSAARTWQVASRLRRKLVKFFAPT